MIRGRFGVRKPEAAAKLALLGALALGLAACGGNAAPGSSGSVASSPAAAVASAAKPAAGASTAASAAVSAKPAASAAASLAAKPAASTATPSGQLKTMKIATPIVGSAFAYLYAARDLGLFRNHGIDPQITALAPANAVAALQSGDLDYAAVVGSVIRSALKGIPERVVSIAANRPNFSILGAKNISSLEQLQGKVVAVDAPGSTSFVMLTELMKRKGLAGKYQTVTANSDETRALLVENNQAAAAIVDVSNGLRLEKDGYPLLAHVADFPEAPFSGMGAATAALQKNREFMKAGLQASLEGVEAMRTRKSDVVPIMVKTLNLTADQAGAVSDQMRGSWTADGKASQAAIDFELSNDQVTLELKEKPRPEQVFDFSLLDEIGRS
jgi:NitT/TauT family transport system substrate-binding protein